jgi:hypothetical protein
MCLTIFSQLEEFLDINKQIKNSLLNRKQMTEETSVAEECFSLLRPIKTKMRTNYSLADLRDAYLGGKLVLKPDFQREFVWNRAMQSRLICAVLQRGPIGSILLWEREHGVMEVVNGQQRLTTLLNFIGVATSNISSGDLITPHFTLKNMREQRFKFLSGITYNDLPFELRERLTSSSIPVEIFSKENDRKDIVQIFIRANT